MRKVHYREFKLLTDMFWGWDLGKIDWILTCDEAYDLVSKYQENIIPLFKKRTVMTGESFDLLVGYAFIARFNMSEEELIANERKCSHMENLTLDGNLYYLPEIVLHRNYRENGLNVMMADVIKYCKANNVDTLYTTAVSNDSRAIMQNKVISNAVTLLDTKEENRQVYKIDITKL